MVTDWEWGRRNKQSSHNKKDKSSWQHIQTHLIEHAIMQDKHLTKIHQT